MEVVIKCSCGNMLTIPAKDGKQAMLRDYLERARLRLIKADHQEIQIRCDNCKASIALRLD